MQVSYLHAVVFQYKMQNTFWYNAFALYQRVLHFVILRKHWQYFMICCRSLTAGLVVSRQDLIYRSFLSISTFNFYHKTYSI